MRCMSAHVHDKVKHVWLYCRFMAYRLRELISKAHADPEGLPHSDYDPQGQYTLLGTSTVHMQMYTTGLTSVNALQASGCCGHGSYLCSSSWVRSVAARFRCSANLGPFLSLYVVLVTGTSILRFFKASAACFGTPCMPRQRVLSKGLNLHGFNGQVHIQSRYKSSACEDRLTM